MPEGYPVQTAVGMSWYKRDDFARIREIMVDREKLHLTFDEWEKAAKNGEAELARMGRTVVRAPLDPDEFIAWCSENDAELNASARNQFAAEFAYRTLVGKS